MTVTFIDHTDWFSDLRTDTVTVVVHQVDSDKIQRARERRRKQRVRAAHKARMRELRVHNREAWRAQP